MSVNIFLTLRTDLTRHNVEVKVQEDFKDLGGDTLDKLDVYIAHCDAVVHLVGNMTGSAPGDLALRALRKRYPDLTDKLPPLGEALRSGISVSYTQWEAWLATTAWRPPRQSFFWPKQFMGQIPQWSPGR